MIPRLMSRRGRWSLNPFIAPMKADQQGDAIARWVIMLIVAIGVLNTVLMSVLERTREYGVLKAIGTTPMQIFWLVICEVVIIALGSICVGVLLGIFVNYLLSIYGITYPQEITYGGMKFKTLYAEVNVRCLMIPAFTVMLSAAVVSLFPAIKAASNYARTGDADTLIELSVVSKEVLDITPV